MSSENQSNEPLSKRDKISVLFITEDDPLYVIQFFDVFFKEYTRENIEVIGITVVEAFHEPIWKTAKRMLNFYGYIDFIRLGFRFVGVKLMGRSISKVAQKYKIPVILTTSVNDNSYIETITRLNPDVIASVAAPEVFKKPILSVPNLKCINIHSGRLPVYRGMMPNFWQLLHGEPNATITIHEMVEKLDAGGILATEEFELRQADSLDRIIIGTKQAGARLMNEVLSNFHSMCNQIQTLDMSEASYFSFPTSKDVRTLRQRGHRML